MGKHRSKQSLQSLWRGPSGARMPEDFYWTPPVATEALLDVERFTSQVWEPACGQGHISRVLEDRGHIVTSSDLVDRGYGESGVDFLSETRRVSNIVTNPPYRLGREFVEHSLECATRKVAMLLRINFLETETRMHLFNDLPFSRLWVFATRVRMGSSKHPGGLGGGVCYAWFVWDQSYVGEPTVGWLKVKR